jgi:predicted nucleic acid-binding protein
MRIYLDTNVFVVAVEQSGAVNELVDNLLLEGERKPGLLVTSELTLAELLVKPFQTRGEGPTGTSESPTRLVPNTIAAIYARLVDRRPGLNVVSIDRSILILSAFHRAADRVLKLPDAIHLATAEQTACTHVISADRGLRPTPHYKFERVDLKANALKRIIAELR